MQRGAASEVRRSTQAPGGWSAPTDIGEAVLCLFLARPFLDRARFARARQGLCSGLSMKPPSSIKRVAVAVSTSDGKTLCGFVTERGVESSRKMLARIGGRLQQARLADSASVVLSIGAATKSFSAFWGAQRELDQA